MVGSLKRQVFSQLAQLPSDKALCGSCTLAPTAKYTSGSRYRTDWTYARHSTTWPQLRTCWYHPQQPQRQHNDELGFDPALGYKVMQFSMEQWTCRIRGAIKHLDLREESPGKAKRCDGAAAMIPQARPLIEVVAAITDFCQNHSNAPSVGYILALACRAMLDSYRRYTAIAQWGQRDREHLVRTLAWRIARPVPPRSTLAYAA